MNSLTRSFGVLTRTRSNISTVVALSMSSSTNVFRSSSSQTTIMVPKDGSFLKQWNRISNERHHHLKRFASSDSSSPNPVVKERFDKLVKNNKVVVFMKGVPDEPRCGFSNAVVQILRMHGVTNYDSHDVLADEVIRQGIKEYTNWPTIPQVFIDGEFVGGCDILIEMHKNGELVEQLSKVGIKSALVKEGESGKNS